MSEQNRQWRDPQPAGRRLLTRPPTSKQQNPHIEWTEQIKMKILTILLVCITPVLADDFKTVEGKEYKGATVTRVEPDGIVVKMKSGISKLYFTELPPEVQQRFNYNPQQASAYSSQQAASYDAYQKKQEEAQQQRQEAVYRASLQGL